jgi:5-methylcytosine-specific restriction enzyme A
MRNRYQSNVYDGRQPRAEQERVRAYDRARASTANRSLYRTAAWKTLRKLHLEEYPGCNSPGCRRPASVVDHVRAHRGNNALFFDQANLQSLCKQCHDRKTVRHDGGFGNARSIAIDDDDDARGFGLV